MATPTIEELRARYFVEVWQPEAFKDRSWRGCAVDRDKYNNTRMPRLLFETIVAASECPLVHVAAEFGSALFASIPATWTAYSAHMLDSAHYSTDYVICDETGQWAFLADFDVTTFGASPQLAAEVDLILSHSGTSLATLTMEDFGDLEDDPHVRSILGVVG